MSSTYQISVQIKASTLDIQGREETVARLRAVGAERVFLCVSDPYCADEDYVAREMEALERECRFFHGLGYEVGVWIVALSIFSKHEFSPMQGVAEEAHLSGEMTCPADERFLELCASRTRRMAACGVDLIMYDDDLRFSSMDTGDVGCLCPHHVRRISEALGEELDRATLAKHIRSGGPNKYRDAWIRVNGEVLRNYAERMRAAADDVNPRIRMGACACLSSWDLDGVSAYELAKIFAGENRPFVRLIGAPYWAARRNWGCRIGDVIEQERMELVWTRQGGEIEIFAEGDTYRPRTLVPSSYLEDLDTALRADGGFDGILKYFNDYSYRTLHEPGYERHHLRNLPTYAAIERMFGGKTAVGLRVYEFPKKVPYLQLGEQPAHPAELQNTFFSAAARSFSATAVPTVYEGEGVAGACFGANAHSLPLEACRGGLILDVKAARILTERGVDVGVRSFGEPFQNNGEQFVKDGDRINTKPVRAHRLTLAEGAVVESHTRTEEAIPLSYRYENAAGERFLVLNFDADGITAAGSFGYETMIHRDYCRARQYGEAVEWLSRGRRLPAHTLGNPDVYLLCKEGDAGELTVGVWNFSVDPIFSTELLLGERYTAISDAYGAEMTLEADGERVRVSSEIPGHGFAAVSLKK